MATITDISVKDSQVLQKLNVTIAIKLQFFNFYNNLNTFNEFKKK